jgi:hypothetical protein
MKDKKYIAMEAMQVYTKTTLAAWDNSLPLHPEMLVLILSTKGCMSSLQSFSK